MRGFMLNGNIGVIFIRLKIMKIYERNVIRKKCINRKLRELRNFMSFFFLSHMKSKSCMRTNLQ